jgi:hypothetical protein
MRRVAALAALLAGTACSGGVIAQELTPRAYWPAPDGTKVFVLAYQHSAGDIVVDPTLPLTGVDSRNDVLQPTYQRFFGLLGRTASLQFALPFADGKTEGFVDDIYRRRLVSGMGDLRARLSVNLTGAPSMNPQEFRALLQDPEIIVGASLTVQAPTGVYDEDRLINIGSNRWSVKPALGMIVPLRPSWLFEMELGAWLYGDNDEFLGETRRQDPIVSAELHLIRVFNPVVWLSVDANYYFGGRSRVGGEPNDDLLRNSRGGLTAVFPIKGRHALRASFSTAISTRSGGDFDNYSLGYFYAWR